MLKKIFIVLLIFSILSSAFIFYTVHASNDCLYVWSNNFEPLSAVSTSSDVSDGNFLNLTCGSAILIDQKTGTVLYDHNMHEQLRPASVTKVMTILLIMEALDNGTISLDTQIPCSENASSMGGSQIWLDTTESLTVNEMLKAICVVSANDCCMAMAEYLAGSEELFVQKMNERAKELGMNDTCFKNCHGIDEDEHVTSSFDIALMSKELLNNHPQITNYTTIWMDSLRNGESELVNTNKLIRNYEGSTGLKTGSTSLALFNLSASATRNNLSLIAVIMKGETSAIRFSEAKTLLDYGFNTYEYSHFANSGDIYKSVSISKGTSLSVDIIYESNSGALIKKGESSAISTNVSLNDNISAPIKKGEILGTISYSLNDTILSTTNLIANNDVKKLTLVNMFSDAFKKWFTLTR